MTIHKIDFKKDETQIIYKDDVNDGINLTTKDKPIAEFFTTVQNLIPYAKLLGYLNEKITEETAEIKEVTYAFTKEGTTISISGKTIKYDFGNRPLNFTTPLILINQDDIRLNGLSELVQTIDSLAINFINGDRIKSTDPSLFDKPLKE